MANLKEQKEIRDTKLPMFVSVALFTLLSLISKQPNSTEGELINPSRVPTPITGEREFSLTPTVKLAPENTVEETPVPRAAHFYVEGKRYN